MSLPKGGMRLIEQIQLIKPPILFFLLSYIFSYSLLVSQGVFVLSHLGNNIN